MTGFQFLCCACAVFFLVWLTWKIGGKLMKYIAAIVGFLIGTGVIVLVIYMIIRGLIMLFTGI